MKIIKEFKEFAVQGNMLDMAIGIIIGGAFGKIITSLVNDIIMPPIGWLIGDMNFSDLSIVLKDAHIDPTTGKEMAAVTLNYGYFIQVTLDFLIVALCIFFVIRLMNRLKKVGAHYIGKDAKDAETPAEPAAPAAPAETPAATPTKQEELLTEIRDLLKGQNLKG